MPGIWNKSGTQRFGLNSAPEVGARCYFFEASSSTPLTTYTDYSLAVPNPAFVETDSYGAWPPVFFDDSTNSFFRERATDAGGSVVYFDNAVIPIVGPGEGGGGAETPVDPNALLETGDIKVSYDTGTKAGFVRGNGRTIGNAVSGASERANADTQDLFEHLYNVDANLTVSGGRGASATADYEANKTLTLPNFCGRVMAALDDMGATAAGVLTGLTTLGEHMGSEDYTLEAGDIPQITGTTGSSGNHDHMTFLAEERGSLLAPNDSQANITFGNYNGESEYAISRTGTSGEADVGPTSTDGSHTHTVTAGDASPDAISLVQPVIGVTVYIKL